MPCKTNLKNNNLGYSFIETIVAVGIFSFVVLIAGSSMQNVSMMQKNSIASQNMQENLRFVFESMSKEIRDAQRATSTCLSGDVNTDYKVFNTNAAASILRFVNKDGLCVFYRVEGNRLRIKRGGDDFFASPDEIEVQDLDFVIHDDPRTAFHSRQPRITMMMRLRIGSLVTTMQTTLSSRYYE